MTKSPLEKIEEHYAAIEELKNEGAAELRQDIAQKNKELADLNEKYAKLTGQKPAEGTRLRRPRITDEELKKTVLKVMATEKEGLAGTQLAEKVGQGYPRIQQFLKVNKDVLKKQGAGPGTRYFLK